MNILISILIVWWLFSLFVCIAGLTAACKEWHRIEAACDKVWKIITLGVLP